MSYAGFPYTPIERATMSVSPDEREEILEALWGEGGFKFLWGGFHDLLRDPDRKSRDLFPQATLNALVRDHVDGTVDHSWQLWRALSTELWLNAFQLA